MTHGGFATLRLCGTRNRDGRGRNVSSSGDDPEGNVSSGVAGSWSPACGEAVSLIVVKSALDKSFHCPAREMSHCVTLS